MSTVVSVVFTVPIFQQLTEIGRKECRGAVAQATFYVEAMAGAAQQEPSFRNSLKRPPNGLRKRDHNHLVVSDDTHDYLFHWANHLGIKMAPFVRMLIYNGISWHIFLAPEEAWGKEELIARILFEFRARRAFHRVH